MRRPLRAPAMLLAGLLALGLLPAAPTSATAPSAAPVILGPDGESLSANPVLRWEPVAGATRYRVQVSTSALFSSLEWSGDVVGTQASPAKDLPLGTIHWRVAGTDGGSGIGPYTTASFERDWHISPVLLTPADEAVIRYPDLVSADPDGRPDDVLPFRWEPVAGAKQYRIEVDDAPDFLGATTALTDSTSWSPTELQTIDQAFYWHVQAVSSNNAVVSDWSETRSYRYTWPDVPQLLTPEPDETVDRDLVFSWEPMPGATTYLLQVSPNGDWTNNLTFEQLVKGTRYSPPKTLDNGSYYWRVRARDAKTVPNLGGWSAERQLFAGWPERPELLLPADDDLYVTVPTFAWTAIPRAAYYELQVSKDQNFSPITIMSCFTTHTRWTPYLDPNDGPEDCGVDLAQGEVYFWRVRGIDQPTGIRGLWPEAGQDAQGFEKEWFSFMWRPGPVALTEPQDGATVDGAPVLSWDTFPGAEKYRVTVTKDSGGALGTVETYSTSWVPTMVMKATDGPFRWFVQSIDAAGVEGIVYPSRSFAWSPPVAAGGLSLLTPVYDPAVPEVIPQSETAPALTWTAVSGAKDYSVWWGRHGTDVFTPFSGGSVGAPGKVNQTGFTFASSAIGVGIYDWYVVAYATNGSVLDISETWTFGIRDLTLATYVAPDDCDSIADCPTIADTPTLSWDGVPGAGSYLVTVANDPAFTNQVITYLTANTELTPRGQLKDSQAGQAYFWFVRPCRSSSVCGPFNGSVYPSAWAFRKKTLAIETLPSSDDGSVADQPVFSWTGYRDTTDAAAPQDARQYRIQVSTVADFASTIDDKLVDQTTYTPYDRTYADGPLYWRVAAIDGMENVLTYGGGQALTKRSGLSLCVDGDPCAPEADETVSGIPAFAWTPQPYTSQYELEVYKSGDLLWSTNNRVITQKTKLVRWTPLKALAPGLYAWRMRRLDPDSKVGAWTAGRLFSVVGEAPVLDEPEDGSTAGTDVSFRWHADTVAPVQSIIETSLSSVFASTVEKVTTVMSSWSPVKVYAKGTYYWRVSGTNGQGAVTATSEVRTFTIGTAVTVTSMAPLADASVTGAWTATFSQAVAGVDAASFTLRVTRTGAEVPGVVTTPDATHAVFTPSTPLVVGESYTASLTSDIQSTGGTPIVPASWAARTSLVADDKGAALVRSWDCEPASAASGGAVDAARLGGATLTFPFTGTQASLLATKGRTSGKAAISLDGRRVATIDLYRASTAWRQVVWSRTGLSGGKHRLEVRVLGTRRAASRGTWVLVDALRAGRTLIQENHAAVVHGFGRMTVSGATGGTVEVTEFVPDTDTGVTPGWRLTFAGTGAAWYGLTGPQGGQAMVFVDDVPSGTVDLYAPALSRVHQVWSVGGLPEGEHVVRITLIAAKAAASTGHRAWLDRVEVTAGLSLTGVTGTQETVADPDPSPIPDASAEPVASSDPGVSAEPGASVPPDPMPQPSPEAGVPVDAAPSPEPGVPSDVQPSPAPEKTAEPTPEPTAEPTPAPTPEVTAEPAPDPTAEPSRAPRPDPRPDPAPEPAPDPTKRSHPDPTPEPAPDPTPEAAPADQGAPPDPSAVPG